MLPDDKLSAWLVISRFVASHGLPFAFPDPILRQLIERGWVYHDPVTQKGNLTVEGKKRVDLDAADFGLAAIPELADPR